MFWHVFLDTKFDRGKNDVPSPLVKIIMLTLYIVTAFDSCQIKYRFVCEFIKLFSVIYHAHIDIFVLVEDGTLSISRTLILSVLPV